MNLKKLNPFKSSNTSNLVQLVEGEFTPVEAADVLLSLINYKIKFHSVQILNLKGMENEAIKKSEKRISELKKAKKNVTQLILKARKKGEKIEVNSIISITTKNQ
jgi:hypothetical protein